MAPWRYSNPVPIAAEPLSPRQAVLLERPTKSPPRPRAARGARSGSALRLASPPAPSPAPRARQVTRRCIPALPAATGRHRRPGRDSATGKRRARRPVRARGWRGRGPREPGAPTPARQRHPASAPAPVPRIPGEPGEPGRGAGRGESGFPGPDGGDSPDLGRRRDPTRATRGTPGRRDRRRHPPGARGIPRAGPGAACAPSTLPRRGRTPGVREVAGGAAPGPPRLFLVKDRSRAPPETGALNSGASPLIVQTQFLYESAANRELWLDICG